MKYGKKSALLVLAAVFAVTGCSKPAAKTAPEAKPAPGPAPTEVRNEPREEFPQPKAEVKEEKLPGSVEDINKRGYLKDVFFDFDKYDVRADQRDNLAADGDWLRKFGTVKFRIEGHCDERGTAQYNLALGEKRANAAKEYLASLGVDGSRVEIVSYGKERPFAQGHDESAWAQNRRGHFVVTSK